jgi:NAD(P)-dependent dehydrogenase (short-subunit alcohol dehydrogenase family)
VIKPCRKLAVFITGCDSGFGYSLALHCHELGFTVIAACHNHNADSGGAQSLKDLSNGEIHVITNFDVRLDESLRSAVQQSKQVLAKQGAQLWCVVNNAAVLVFGEAEWQSRAMVQHQLEVNLVGPLAVSKAFLPLLRAAKGRIINMVSFCTDCPMPTLSIYTATKAALRSLSAGMRMELARFGVHVVLLNPGDHPSETPLCSGQNHNYDIMKKEVAGIEDAEQSINKYFEACRGKFTTLFPPPALKRLHNPGFYSVTAEILTSIKPKPEYVNSDLGTKLFFAFVAGLPTGWADYVRIKLLRLPEVD